VKKTSTLPALVILPALVTIAVSIGMITVPSLLEPSAKSFAVSTGASIIGLGKVTPKAPQEALLGSYETHYALRFGRDPRGSNVELGAQKLNEVVLEPGAEWSFNSTVGPRTKEEGFESAPVLFLGEVREGLGGGMCQVSSTMFAASLMSGLDIVSRHSHSRPSSYIPKGFDATVNYPEECWGTKQNPEVCYDLGLRNPYGFPIRISTSIGFVSFTTKKLVVELWGLGPTAKVSTTWKAGESKPFEKRVHKEERKGDWKLKKQVGKDGQEGVLTVDRTWPDGHKDRRRMTSTYKPVDEVWYVGQDWNDALNPWE
jgi:hypothetical protein